MKNILFQDIALFQEGQKYFAEGDYHKSLMIFNQFSEKYPNGKIFITGRIALTLMKLNRFAEAKEYLKDILQASAMPTPHKEKDYNCLYAECLYALGKTKQAEELCFKIQEKHPDANIDLDQLLRKVSIHPNIDTLRTYMDWNERKECLQAMEGIIEILAHDNDIEEAALYSYTLIHLRNNFSVKPYQVLKEYYNRTKNYHYCGALLKALEKSMVPLVERNNAMNEILAVYKLSVDFLYSSYNDEHEYLSNLAPIEELTDVIVKKPKLLWADWWTEYIPVLNLDKYFKGEPQLELA